VNSKLVQEAAEVMKTDFWKQYISRLAEKRQFLIDRFCKDSVESQAQWIRHALYQGELKGLEYALTLPDDILTGAKGTPAG
jgi:IS1 family transposase